MKRGSTRFLQIIVVLIGAGAVALMLWEPQLEGRNAHAMLSQIYLGDPFLAYAYAASAPFFVALYQAFKALACAGRDDLFSPDVLKALRTIRYCGAALVGLVALGEIFIRLGDSDDRAGGVFMGMLISLGAGAMAAAAVVLERVLRKKMRSTGS